MAMRGHDLAVDRPRRTVLVALVAAVGGCSSLPPPRATAPPAMPAAPPAPPAPPDDGPSADLIARENPQVSPAVARAIAHVIRQPSDHPRAAVLDFAAHSSTPRFH